MHGQRAPPQRTSDPMIVYRLAGDASNRLFPISPAAPNMPLKVTPSLRNRVIHHQRLRKRLERISTNFVRRNEERCGSPKLQLQLYPVRQLPNRSVLSQSVLRSTRNGRPWTSANANHKIVVVPFGVALVRQFSDRKIM